MREGNKAHKACKSQKTAKTESEGHDYIWVAGLRAGTGGIPIQGSCSRFSARGFAACVFSVLSTQRNLYARI